MEKIFDVDELELVPIRNPEEWDAEKLLASTGLFFWKDVAPILGTKTVALMKHIKTLRVQEQSPWEVMGIRKVWNHWVVRMKVFGPYYRQHLQFAVKDVSDHWDGNQLLRQQGRFYLSDACAVLPFTANQVRYLAKKVPNAHEVIGVWKDEDHHRYVVDMETFATWIKRIWRGNRP